MLLFHGGVVVNLLWSKNPTELHILNDKIINTLQPLECLKTSVCGFRIDSKPFAFGDKPRSLW